LFTALALAVATFSFGVCVHDFYYRRKNKKSPWRGLLRRLKPAKNPPVSPQKSLHQKVEGLIEEGLLKSEDLNAIGLDPSLFKALQPALPERTTCTETKPAPTNITQKAVEPAERKRASVSTWVERIRQGEASFLEALSSEDVLSRPLLKAYLHAVEIPGKSWRQERGILSKYTSSDFPVLSPPSVSIERDEAHTKFFRVHVGKGDFIRKGVKPGHLFTLCSSPGDRKTWKPIFTSRILSVDLDSLTLEDVLPTKYKNRIFDDAEWTCYGKWVIHPPLPAGVIFGDRRQPVSSHRIIYSMEENPHFYRELLLEENILHEETPVAETEPMSPAQKAVVRWSLADSYRAFETPKKEDIRKENCVSVEDVTLHVESRARAIRERSDSMRTYSDDLKKAYSDYFRFYSDRLKQSFEPSTKEVVRKKNLVSIEAVTLHDEPRTVKARADYLHKLIRKECDVRGISPDSPLILEQLLELQSKNAYEIKPEHADVVNTLVDILKRKSEGKKEAVLLE